MARISAKSERAGLLLDLGVVIRRRRKDKNMSQEALALAAGIDRSHMGKIERGERNVTLLNLQRIADALEEKPSGLLGNAGH